MADLSFLLSHLLVVFSLFVKHDTLETSELFIGLAVVLPSLLVQSAFFLPRLTGPHKNFPTSRAKSVAAWIVGAAFIATSEFIIRQLILRELYNEGWQMSLLLAGTVGGYGIYAAWFVQSRALISEKNASTMRNLLTQPNFDVFLCHNSEDKMEVKSVAMQLMEKGIRPWLDEWELQPGMPWRVELEKQIEKIRAAAVFVGPSGMGPWQDEEISSFLSEFVNRKIPVIPVILPTALAPPKLPPFLNSRTWVDFRRPSPDPIEQMIFGICGKKKGESTSANQKKIQDTSGSN